MVINRYFLLIILFLFSCDSNPTASDNYNTFFNLSIEETGESTLLIFQNTISSLDLGDQIGVFDLNGIIDNQGNTGEILVGHGTWDGDQLEIVAIMAQDLSSFDGPILPGAINTNNVNIKVWKDNTQILEENITFEIATGAGTFNGLFTAYSELTIQE